MVDKGDMILVSFERILRSNDESPLVFVVGEALWFQKEKSWSGIRTQDQRLARETAPLVKQTGLAAVSVSTKTSRIASLWFSLARCS